MNATTSPDSSSYGTAGRLYSEMAEFDLAMNQTIYKDRLTRLFSQARTIEQLFPTDAVSFASSALWLNFILAYSIAATRAYKAYSDKSFLEFAETAWRNGREYTLSEDDLQAGTIAGKNMTLKKTCLSLSMAVLISRADRFPLNPGIEISLPSQSDRISGRSDTEPDGAFLDGIDAATCTPGTENAHPYNAGLMMEGLAVLANVTQNATIEEHLMEVIDKTVPNRSWQGADGIIAAD
ncbi:hypothetical protein MPER_10958, partial [Moniliophthora perniciosa FA553]